MTNNKEIHKEEIEVVELFDEKGKSLVFELLSNIEDEGNKYLVLTSFIEDESQIDPKTPAKVFVMQEIIKDVNKKTLEPVSDSAVVEKIFNKFKGETKEKFDFADTNSLTEEKKKKQKVDNPRKEILELEKIYGITLKEIDKSRNIFHNDNCYQLNNNEIIGLNLSKDNIKKIKGLGKLFQLQELSLWGNQIAEIKGLEKLIRLKKLWLGNNKITEIKGLEKLTQLQELRLSDNKISEIKGLDNLTQLQDLDLGFFNQITEIKGLEKLTKLRRLRLSFNQISEIKGLDNLTQLQDLDLCGNSKIAEIKGLEKLLQLQSIKLSGNQITEIKGLEKLTQLLSLDLGETQITNIKGLEVVTAQLQDLDLRRNQITDIKGIGRFLQLQKLNLSYNLIEEIHELEDLTQLQELNLSCNQITEIKGLKKLKELKKLDLFENKIINIDDLENFFRQGKFVELRINNNPFLENILLINMYLNGSNQKDAILEYFDEKRSLNALDEDFIKKGMKGYNKNVLLRYDKEDVYLQIGYANHNKGNFDDAITCFKMYAKLNLRYPDELTRTLLAISNTYKAKGDKKKAKQYREKAKQMSLEGMEEAMQELRKSVGDETLEYYSSFIKKSVMEHFDFPDEETEIEDGDRPVIFISYSWDDEKHKKWVLDLAYKLCENGVNVLLDRFDLTVGKDMNFFMENSVNSSRKVLLIMTPNYKKRAEKREGGVGYEISMITAQIVKNHNTDKFIPILRNGQREESTPNFIETRIDIDMRDDSSFENSFEELLRTIYNEPKIVRPKKWKKPRFLK